jgi:hypothetical protein
MNFKTTYVLFGILVVMLVAFTVVVWRYGGEVTDTSNYLLPGVHDPASPVKAENVTSVEIRWTEPAQTLAFRRSAEGKRWEITEPRPLRANNTSIDGLIQQLFDAQRDLKSGPLTNLKDLGLDPPHEVITLRTDTDRQFTVNIGTTSPGKGANTVVYASSADRPGEACAIPKGSLDDALHGLASSATGTCWGPAPATSRRSR